MTGGMDRAYGEVYDPAADGSDPLAERAAGDEAAARDDARWPAPAYEPPGTEGAGGSREADASPDRRPADDPALARLLLDRLRGSGDDVSPEQGLALPLEAPDLRRRVLDRLEGELLASTPDLLVATGPGGTEVGTPLADRTGLPLVRETAVPGDPERWRGARVALVGAVLRPTAIAGVLRAVEARGATVVAIVGVAARDGEDTELMDEHYNLFHIIHL